LVVRYDAKASFTSPSSWSAFDVATVTAGATGFFGAAFDARYVYFIPWFNTAYSGVVARYDSLGSFSAAGSWSTFDVATVNAGAAGFIGAAFDGRYLYLAPNRNPGG